MRDFAFSWKWLGHQAIRALPLVLVVSCGSPHPSSLPLPAAEPQALSSEPFVVPTLHGETLSGKNPTYAGCSSGGGYSGATGTATGPYPGTFGSSVRWREVAYRIYSVSGTFSITSGQYLISGTMSGPVYPLYIGTCYVAASISYSANISKGGVTLSHVTGAGSLRFQSRHGGSFFAAF